MKGGNTNTIDTKKITVNKDQIIKRENGLDIFNKFLTLLQRLQIMFAITSEHSINKKKSFKLQNIKKLMPKIINLRIKELFKFLIFYFYLFSEYPNPFDLA
tara:strand:- start:2 stop:304 length:303 start_codon:yes stop_codon:yes gene_type:complete